MKRGAGLVRATRIASEIGLEAGEEARETDLDAERSRLRFSVFKTEVAACMAVTKDTLRTVFIDASGTPEAVAARTKEAFRYSAALDLDPHVYELVRGIRSSKSLVRSARTELVMRLSAYAEQDPEMLKIICQVLQKEFMAILARQALSGAAIVRSSNKVFEQSAAVNMALDVLTERGYNVVLDVQRQQVPFFIDAQGNIKTNEVRVLAFSITWAKPLAT